MIVDYCIFLAQNINSKVSMWSIGSVCLFILDIFLWFKFMHISTCYGCSSQLEDDGMLKMPCANCIGLPTWSGDGPSCVCNHEDCESSILKIIRSNWKHELTYACILLAFWKMSFDIKTRHLVHTTHVKIMFII